MYTICTMVSRIGQLAQELSRLNPWWRDPNWAASDGDLREAADTELNYRSGVLDGLESGSLYILRGPRRVGKTVSVKQSIEKLVSEGYPPTAIVRAATDGWAAKDLRTLTQNTALPLEPDGVSRIWFLDEVSAISGEWDTQVKWLRDNDESFRRATVVLTGSDAEALTAAGGTLAGRRGQAPDLDRYLFPVGFRTFVELVSRKTPPTTDGLALDQLHSSRARHVFESLVPWLDELVTLWEMYIAYGGFPQAVAAAKRHTPVPPAFLEDLFEVIAGDAFRQSRLSRTGEMALLERLWESMSTPANLTQIATSIGAASTTVSRHVEYLRDAYLLWRCHQRADDHWTAREGAQSKLYAVDPLVARLAHLRNPDRTDIDPTTLTEQQIGMGLRRSVYRETAGAPADEFLFYVRTPTRKEIDFVARPLAGVAIEGKYTEGGKWRGEAATVIASDWFGILATRNVLDLSQDDAWAVPAGLLMYAVDS